MSAFDFGQKPAKREPNADLRNMAKFLHEFYTANLDEGFTRAQALQLTITFLEVTVANGIDQGDGGNAG